MCRIERTQEILGDTTLYRKPGDKAEAEQRLAAILASFQDFREAYEGFLTYYGYDKEVVEKKPAAAGKKAASGTKVLASN